MLNKMPFLKKSAFTSALSLLIFCSAACSLKYSETVNAEETNPEFIFNHAKLVLYENGKETVVVNADNIEQYKDSDITYGKNVTFTTYDDDHKVETEGYCGLLYADNDKEQYELYDGIKLYNRSQNTYFFANMLKWNGAKIEKDGTVIYGTGFSASGVSKTYSFAGTVSGQIEAKDKNQDENQEEQGKAQE